MIYIPSYCLKCNTPWLEAIKCPACGETEMVKTGVQVMENCNQCGAAHAAAKEVVLKESIEDSGAEYNMDIVIKSNSPVCVRCAIQLMYKGLAKMEGDFSCSSMIVEGMVQK